ncbi:hypothetical protein GGR54DRAFT_572676 [Hypoxylon sp. NC1633]|nr:hypothetical protein GGR54DRAFT_572676 [Hypoxylon sp. NC1633]
MKELNIRPGRNWHRLDLDHLSAARNNWNIPWNQVLATDDYDEFPDQIPLNPSASSLDMSWTRKARGSKNIDQVPYLLRTIRYQLLTYFMCSTNSVHHSIQLSGVNQEKSKQTRPSQREDTALSSIQHKHLSNTPRLSTISIMPILVIAFALLTLAVGHLGYALGR